MVGMVCAPIIISGQSSALLRCARAIELTPPGAFG